MTCRELRLDIAREANPLMVPVMALPPEISLPARALWMLLMLSLLKYLSGLKPRLVTTCVFYLTLFYVFIILYHLLILLVSV
ncbi:MAG: hypothetical protein XD97_0758 [Pelotomaculum thermopropionicum]|uniref:DUF5658 domain-containing protein n=1 Tax=Pelotomaculum thermopropionicum TaxID=110500 RepID=A0A101HQ24_9FIRM|nr:MAG: hypothetical protein XD97_0758 [Pelotomaculum thermopropionicum]